MLIFVCAGCGAESANSEKTEAAQTTITEETSPEQSVEATATPVETESPTPEKAEDPSEEIAPEAEVPEATSEPTAEPIPEPQVVYTYTDISATMYATQTVNVRNLPNTDGEKVEVQQTTGGSGGGGNASAGVPNPFTVERRVWHDMGTYAFYVDTYYIRADVVYADRPTVLSDGSIAYGGADHKGLYPERLGN